MDCGKESLGSNNAKRCNSCAWIKKQIEHVEFKLRIKHLSE